MDFNTNLCFNENKLKILLLRPKMLCFFPILSMPYRLYVPIFPLETIGKVGKSAKIRMFFSDSDPDSYEIFQPL